MQRKGDCGGEPRVGKKGDPKPGRGRGRRNVRDVVRDVIKKKKPMGIPEMDKTGPHGRGRGPGKGRGCK